MLVTVLGAGGSGQVGQTGHTGSATTTRLSSVVKVEVEFFSVTVAWKLYDPGANPCSQKVDVPPMFVIQLSAGFILTDGPLFWVQVTLAIGWLVFTAAVIRTESE